MYARRPLAIAAALSRDRRAIPWRVVLWGIGLQLGLAVLLLATPFGRTFFVGVNDLVNRLLVYSEAGARFVFGGLMETGASFALNVLPVIIFMGSLISVLDHLGVVLQIVNAFAWALSKAE